MFEGDINLKHPHSLPCSPRLIFPYLVDAHDPIRLASRREGGAGRRGHRRFRIAVRLQHGLALLAQHDPLKPRGSGLGRGRAVLNVRLVYARRRRVPRRRHGRYLDGDQGARVIRVDSLRRRRDPGPGDGVGPVVGPGDADVDVVLVRAGRAVLCLVSLLCLNTLFGGGKERSSRCLIHIVLPTSVARLSQERWMTEHSTLFPRPNRSSPCPRRDSCPRTRPW